MKNNNLHQKYILLIGIIGAMANGLVAMDLGPALPLGPTMELGPAMPLVTEADNIILMHRLGDTGENLFDEMGGSYSQGTNTIKPPETQPTTHRTLAKKSTAKTSHLLARNSEKRLAFFNQKRHIVGDNTLFKFMEKVTFTNAQATLAAVRTALEQCATQDFLLVGSFFEMLKPLSTIEDVVITALVREEITASMLLQRIEYAQLQKIYDAIQPN